MLKSTALFYRWDSCFPAVSVSALLCIQISRGSCGETLGVKQQPVHAGNSLLCTETGTDGKEGGHIASSPEILAPGEPTVPFGLYQRRCPHWCHPRIGSFSFPNASQSPLLLSASSIPSAFKLQSLKAKVNDLLV